MAAPLPCAASIREKREHAKQHIRPMRKEIPFPKATLALFARHGAGKPMFFHPSET